MSCLVELQYNPYMPQVQILINGRQPPDFSRLIQYSDEDIWLWIYEIMDSIYLEVRDDYYITFTGTLQDAVIVKYVCENSAHCIGFRHIEFSVKDDLPKRMRQLNQMIKNEGITVYERTIIDASFWVENSFQHYLEEIIALDINNLFCTVRVNTIGYKTSYGDKDNSILFILEDSVEEAEKKLQYLKMKKPAFVLIAGNEKKILKIKKYGWFIQIPEEALFNTIFDCFIQIPLRMSFRKCVYSIQNGNERRKNLEELTCIEPSIDINVEKEVEAGKSIRIKVLRNIEVGEIPKLIFNVSNPKVASCDGLAVHGIQEGICVLEVYKLGSKQPFFSQEIKVFKRNRIKKMILSEKSLSMGINDKGHIGLDYYPEDADNIRAITWKSSDENIIKVDSNGNIVALNAGECRILCIAENVSAQCMCTVKPYLSDIETNLQLDEKERIYMEPLEEMKISIKCIPEDCIDGEITFESSDINIVNVVNKTMYAKKVGTATITMKNNTNKISRCFNVSVCKKKPKGFFRLFFK